MRKYGVDVAATRADDLDRALLQAVTEQRTDGLLPTVLDIGCGSGGLAGRLAATGARVTALDVVNHESAWTARNQMLSSNVPPISFITTPLQTYLQQLTTAQQWFDYVVLQRTLHYLSYQQAGVALQQLSACTTSALYLSVTGTTSAIAAAHPAVAKPLPQRFAPLSSSAQTTFSIQAPICVYRQAEFTSLLEQSNWQVQQQWTSAFGNHKAIARPVSA